MTKEMVAITQGRDESQVSLSSEHIIVTSYGVEFDPDHKPDIKEWHQAVLGVQKANNMMQWYLGDLAVYAESPVTGWGESKYKDLIAATGYEYDTMSKFAQLARRFTPMWRKEFFKRWDSNPNVLGIMHFRLVASLDDNFAGYWLQKAAEAQWGVARLREELAAWKAERNGEVVIDAEDEEGDNIPTFTQQIKELATWARTYSKDNNADLIRIQVIKDGHVIDEKTTEVY